ncbi:hypothetical protein F4604DRAFT_1692425 [Suillus subluteus]|nr:hypothetical protein F4604DRAFT_1692425 [Suillus subluteus]
MARQCCICQYPWSILVHLHLQGYVESVVYPWWNETTGTWVWTIFSAMVAKHSCISPQRLSSFTSSGISQGEFQILFKNWVDGLRWWIDCQSNPMMQLQFELRLLLFLLEEHVYSGDLWCLVMAHQIEVMQEERLHKIQPQNCSTPACFAEDREFLEDKKDRAQMELSLYSQAIAVSQLQLGSRYGHPVSMGDRSFPANFSRVDSASLHQTELAHAKCREWLSSVTIGVCVAGGRPASAKDTGPDELTSIASNLMTMYKTLVLPTMALCPYRLVSTWVEECMEYYMDDRATERASLEIMISQAGDLSDTKAEVCFLEAELCLVQSQLWCAQTEVELLSDTIQYLIESDTSEYTLLDSQEFTLVDTGQYALWEVLSHVVAHLLTSMNAY